jgi:ABC-type multidrug transport system fused ATPase/permease subunit
MPELMYFMRRLHAVAGAKLYVNFVGMMLISSIEGVSIYLLIPLLGLTGIFNLGSLTIPFLDNVNSVVHQIPGRMQFATMIVLYVLLVISQAIIQRNQTVLNTRIQQSFIRSLRLSTYRDLLQAEWKLYLRTRKSDISHILNNELVRIIVGTGLAMRLATTIIFTLIQVAFAFWLSYKLTLLVLLCGTLMAIFSRRFSRRAKTIGVETTELTKSYIAGITDHFNGIKDIKTNMLEHQHYNWFLALCKQLESNFIKFAKLQTSTQLFYKTTSAILIGLFIYVSFEVLHVSGGELMLIIVIFSRLWPKFITLQNSWEQIVTSIPAFTSLMELQKECAETKEFELRSADEELAIRMESEIECRNMSYRYDPNKPEFALKDVNIRVPANSMTAIVGRSGAGKSTLIDLLIGLVRPESGEVLYDGVPLTARNTLAHRRMVSYVPQDPFLFHSSIRDNLKLVDPHAIDERLWEALRFAAAEDFVRKLPDGLDTIIGDRGIRLSGGERQRLVLARAILRKPSILVLDEATSALDNENEAKIQAALERLKGSMTIVVIAHRLSTIRNADQVIVIEQGRVVQQGAYHQLSSETRGTFSRLLSYQEAGLNT